MTGPAHAPAHYFGRCPVCLGHRPVGADGLLTPHGRFDESAAEPADADLIACAGSGKQPVPGDAA